MDHSVITEVTHLPRGKYNLFSLTRMIKLGWTMKGDKTSLVLMKGSQKVVFDIVIPTGKGMLFGMYFRRDGEIAGAMTELKTRKMTVNEAHNKLGHSDEATTRKTARELGIEIVRGTMRTCAACTVAKAKQKNVPKTSDTEKGTKEDRRVFLDISTIKSAKDGPNVTKPNWRIMVDEHSSMKFTHFYQTKNGMVEPTCETLNKWKQDGHAVQNTSEWIMLGKTSCLTSEQTAKIGNSTSNSSILDEAHHRETTWPNWDLHRLQIKGAH